MPYSFACRMRSAKAADSSRALVGNAADVEAGAADLRLVDEGDLQPELGCAECGGVAASSGAEDDEIEVVGGADGHRVGWYGGGLVAALRAMYPRRRCAPSGPPLIPPAPTRSCAPRDDDRVDPAPRAARRRRLPRRVDPGRRAGRASERRPRSTDHRLRPDRWHERAAGLGSEMGRRRRRRRPRQGRRARAPDPAPHRWRFHRRGPRRRGRRRGLRPLGLPALRRRPRRRRQGSARCS